MTTPTMSQQRVAQLAVDCFDSTPADARWIEAEARHIIGHYLGHDGWKFVWDTKRSAWGHCYYLTRTITLSRPLMTTCTRGEVRQTLLHEIAHAMTPGCKHNRTWKIKAQSLGHPNPSATSNHSGDPGDHKWALYCDRCEALVVRRYRRSDMRGRLHSKCGGTVHWEAL